MMTNNVIKLLNPQRALSLRKALVIPFSGQFQQSPLPYLRALNKEGTELGLNKRLTVKQPPHSYTYALALPSKLLIIQIKRKTMALLGLYVVIENSTLWVRNIVKQQTFYFLVRERKAFIISVVVSSRLQKEVHSIVQLLR